MTPPTVDPSLLKKCPLCNATVYADPCNRKENEYEHSEGCPIGEQQKTMTVTKTGTITGPNNTIQATKTVTATITPNPPNPPATDNFAISPDWWGKISCPFAAFLYANGTNNVKHKKVWTLDNPSQLPAGLVFSQFPPGAACIAGVPQGPGSQGKPFIVDLTCTDEENGDVAHIAFEIYIDSLD